MSDTTRHDSRQNADTTPTRRVTVKEAAALLDVTPMPYEPGFGVAP